MNEKNFNRPKPEYSVKIKAGEKRTYFIDVQKSKVDELFMVISETNKKSESEPLVRNKIFVYKEELSEFINELEKAALFIKNQMASDLENEKKKIPTGRKRLFN
jgi:hypothetical protein